MKCPFCQKPCKNAVQFAIHTDQSHRQHLSERQKSILSDIARKRRVMPHLLNGFYREAYKTSQSLKRVYPGAITHQEKTQRT